MGSKAAFWRRHLVAWRGCGLGQAAYCRHNGLNLPCFGYWRGKLGTVSSPSTMSVLPMDRMEVALPNGLHVYLSVGSDAAQWVPMIQKLIAC
jgi:hypothetical protein